MKRGVSVQGVFVQGGLCPRGLCLELSAKWVLREKGQRPTGNDI